MVDLSKYLFMKFCSKCDAKLSQNFEDVGAPGICPKCNPEKIISKRPPME